MYVEDFCLVVVDHGNQRRYTCPIVRSHLHVDRDHIVIPNKMGRGFIPTASPEAVFYIRQLDSESFDVELYSERRLKALQDLAEMTVTVERLLKTQMELCEWARPIDHHKYKRLHDKIPAIRALIEYHPREI